MGDVDIAVSVDSAGGLFCRDRDPEIIARALNCLAAQPWCGALADAAGTHGLTLADLGLDGPRAPDIALVLAAVDDDGPYGWRGSTVHDAAYPNGGGIHGGLHPLELNNWLAMAGTKFGPAQTIATPAGITDVLPTVLQVLGAAISPQIQGRVLTEALGGAPIAPVAITRNKIANLRISQVGTTRYLDGLASPLPGQ